MKVRRMKPRTPTREFFSVLMTLIATLCLAMFVTSGVFKEWAMRRMLKLMRGNRLRMRLHERRMREAGTASELVEEISKSLEPLPK